MTEQEIREKWFPICQPDNLVKRTELDDNHEVSFFYVLGEPRVKKVGTSDINELEVWCVEVSRPNFICDINKPEEILDIDQTGPRNLFTTPGHYTLELSSFDEMLKYYDELYEREIREMQEHIRLIKSHIQTFRRTQRTLSDTIRQRYEYAVSAPAKAEKVKPNKE